MLLELVVFLSFCMVFVVGSAWYQPHLCAKVLNLAFYDMEPDDLEDRLRARGAQARAESATV
eukprot:5393306-Amphidinium_carterae.1